MINSNISVFLTVGSKRQEELCKKMLSTIGIINNYDFTVISDDDNGCRLGSGGAVLNIIRNHYEPGKKMLIINSGGLSKRSINYAVRGKAFANVLYNNEILTLLELIVINAQKILDSFSSGVLICCSDILVDTNQLKFSFTESTGICIKTNYTTGSRHGVMLCESSEKMLKYLHKRSAEELEDISHKFNNEGVLVDTGISYFSKDLSDTLYKLVCNKQFFEQLFCHKFELNLYSDIISLLGENITREEYLKTETMNEHHLNAKMILFDNLSSFTMRVIEIQEQHFMHFGSMKESLENIVRLSKNNKHPLFFNSFSDKTSVIGTGTMLDNSQIESCEIGNGCIISDVTLENITVADNNVVCGIKLIDGTFVTIVCNINENPKDTIDGESIWEIPRFYKGKTFTDSLEKFYENSSDEKYSLEYCIENADFDYCFNRQQYLKDKNNYAVNEYYLKRRAEIIDHYFSWKEPLKQIRCLKNRVEVSLPLRVNLSGTWTDAMPYCVDNGGQIINMAITVDGKNPISVIVEKLDNARIEFGSDGINENFSFVKNSYEEDLSDFNLHKAALKVMGVNSETIITNGFRLTVNVSGIDKGSGLGTSSILLGGCFIALGKMFGIEYSTNELIRMVFVAEQLMKTGGGWQDQVGGLTPGLKIETSCPGIDQNINIEHISLSPFFEKLISERLVLVPTGQRHFGRFIVNDVANRYLQGIKESLDGHKKIRELNDVLINSFNADDYDGFVQCINNHCELLKLISPKVTNKTIDRIISMCFEKADAVSILGAGGGGYLLAVLKKDVSINEFKDFVKNRFPSIGSDIKKIDICYDI